MKSFDEYLIERFNNACDLFERNMIEFIQEVSSDIEHDSLTEYDACEIISEFSFYFPGYKRGVNYIESYIKEHGGY